MTKREVMRTVLEGGRPPYVPWSCGFTKEAWEKLVEHFGTADLEDRLGNHIVTVGFDMQAFEDIGNGRVRDTFGVVWDRSVDKDIGIVRGCLLPEPTLREYTFPDPLAEARFANIEPHIARFPDRFRVFEIGFSLFERAWTLRGMENLLMDFCEHPSFAHELLETLGDWNVTQVRKAVTHDIDAVYFGDDWGHQSGVIMGPEMWREFIKPVLTRQYREARQAGKFVMIHSCGDVDELLDELADIGLNCFNPFQPEVMDVYALLEQYRGRLAFHGGMSTQRTLPFGTTEDVRAETRRLLSAGSPGGYIFAPAHAVEGDVPLENMLAFLDVIQSQEGAS